MIKKNFLKKKKKYKEGEKKSEEGEGNSNWIKGKRRKPWHAASSWQMHSKKKKNWQMDMIRWKLGVG